MDRSIAPTLVKESICTIQVLEKGLVSRTSPEFQIANLKITPKMASAIPISLVVDVWSLGAIR